MALNGIGFSSHTSGDGFSLYTLEKPKAKKAPNNFQTAPFSGGFFVHQFFLVRINVTHLMLRQQAGAMILGDRFGVIRTMGRCDS